MRVGTKLALALAVPIILLIAAFGYVDIRRSSERYRDELRREGRTTTRTVQLAMQDALRDKQLSDIQHLVDEVTGFERVLGLRLFDQNGTMTYQSEILKSQAFTGREALVQVLTTHEPAETRTDHRRRVGPHVHRSPRGPGSLALRRRPASCSWSRS